MIDAEELKRLVEAWVNRKVSEHAVSDFLMANLDAIIALAEANVARRRKALDELIAMDADLYDDPPPEPAQ